MTHRYSRDVNSPTCVGKSVNSLVTTFNVVSALNFPIWEEIVFNGFWLTVNSVSFVSVHSCDGRDVKLLRLRSLY